MSNSVGVIRLVNRPTGNDAMSRRDWISDLSDRVFQLLGLTLLIIGLVVSKICLESIESNGAGEHVLGLMHYAWWCILCGVVLMVIGKKMWSFLEHLVEQGRHQEAPDIGDCEARNADTDRPSHD